jgi:hypothetical protein
MSMREAVELGNSWLFDCATWVFAGNKGHGQWSDGAIADLSVGHSDSDVRSG